MSRSLVHGGGPGVPGITIKELCELRLQPPAMTHPPRAFWRSPDLLRFSGPMPTVDTHRSSKIGEPSNLSNPAAGRKAGREPSGSRWNSRHPKGCFVTKDAEICNSSTSIWKRDRELSGVTLITEPLSLTIRAWASVGELGPAVCRPFCYQRSVWDPQHPRNDREAYESCWRRRVALSLSCGGEAGDGRASRTLIQNKGSDTLVNVAQAWAEAYGLVHPNVAVAVTGGGSGTGIQRSHQRHGGYRQRLPGDPG